MEQILSGVRVVEVAQWWFVPSAGAWGRQGATNVRLKVAKAAAVRGAMVLAWEGAMKKPVRKRKPVRRG